MTKKPKTSKPPKVSKPSKKDQKEFADAVKLVEVENSFMELGEVLHKWQEAGSEALRDFKASSGMVSRKVYYLIEIHKAFDHLKVPKERLRNIGWTKLKEIAKKVNKKNCEDLLQYAETHTAKEVQAYMQGGVPEDNAHSITFYFNTESYERFVDALVEHGATRKPRGIDGKEEALARLVASKTKK